MIVPLSFINVTDGYVLLPENLKSEPTENDDVLTVYFKLPTFVGNADVPDGFWCITKYAPLIYPEKDTKTEKL